MKNYKFFSVGILSLVFCLTVAGCVSYNHTQAVRNETGHTVTEVYIRDTGTTDWGNVKNVQARRDADGLIIYRETSQGSVVAYWDRFNINNATQVIFFRESGSSETPRTMRNQDIAIKDSNGLLYMKHNIPITFSTTKNTSYILIDGPSETLVTSTPITFTVQDRLPMLFVVNQTGHSVNLLSPTTGTIANNARTQFQPMEINRPIDVVYSIGQARYTEQVTMNNADATVTLTRRPPTLTIVNNTGVGNAVNIIQFRATGSAAWVGGNIAIRNNEFILIDGTAQTGVTTQALANGDRLQFWLGNLSVGGDSFDIRLQTPSGNIFQRDNVRTTADLTLTFTVADRR